MIIVNVDSPENAIQKLLEHFGAADLLNALLHESGYELPELASLAERFYMDYSDGTDNGN